MPSKTAKSEIAKKLSSGLPQQLLVLKQMTQTTGMLHEAQILQLKLWPYVLFPKTKVKYTLKIDPTKKQIEYEFIGKYPKGKWEVLERDIQWLLGDEWYLLVRVGPKAPLGLKAVVFKGSRKIVQDTGYQPFIAAVDDYGTGWLNGRDRKE